MEKQKTFYERTYKNGDYISIDLRECILRNFHGCWENNVGKKIYYTFNDINGFFTILSYNKEVLIIEDSISQRTCKIAPGNLKKCQLSNFFYQKQTVDITHPHIVQYLCDKNDASKYTFGSNSIVQVECPLCHSKTNMSIKQLCKCGVTCKKCGDGISYPEKFFMSLLEQLNIDFIYQYTPEWVKPKRYDFYIPSLKCIVETHGAQHYKNTQYGTYEQQLEINNLKKGKAILNGIDDNKYISIDCRKSEKEFIKNNIINSNLKDFINFNSIDWDMCDKGAYCNKMKIACDLSMKLEYRVDNFIDTVKIANELHIASHTVVGYLTKGKEFGWTDYDAKINIKLANARLKGRGKNYIGVNDKGDIVFKGKRQDFISVDYYKMICRKTSGKRKSNFYDGLYWFTEEKYLELHNNNNNNKENTEVR